MVTAATHIRESLTNFSSGSNPVYYRNNYIMQIRMEILIMRKEKFLTTVSTKQNENGGMMVKKRFAEVKKKLVPAVSGSMMAVMLMSSTCFAAGAGTSAVTQPLENLKTLIIAVIGAVGVIILAKNVMEFAQW